MRAASALAQALHDFAVAEFRFGMALGAQGDPMMVKAARANAEVAVRKTMDHLLKAIEFFAASLVSGGVKVPLEQAESARRPRVYVPN